NSPSNTSRSRQRSKAPVISPSGRCFSIRSSRASAPLNDSSTTSWTSIERSCRASGPDQADAASEDAGATTRPRSSCTLGCVIRLAILGFWHVHASDYAADAQAHPETEIVAAWDDDATRGAARAAELGVPFQ